MTNNTQDNTNVQHDSIGFDQVQEFESGNAIAVRAVEDQVTIILAGKIEKIQSTDPESMLDESEEGDAYGPYVHIDADIWWIIDGNEVKDESACLQDRQPYQPCLDEPPIDAPLCTLELGPNRSVLLMIPLPNTNGSRVVSYYPNTFALVIECEFGPIVEPTRVLPDTHDPPESSSQ